MASLSDGQKLQQIGMWLAMRAFAIAAGYGLIKIGQIVIVRMV